MAQIKVYLDEDTRQIVLEGISREFPKDFEITYNNNKVYFKNLNRNEYDAILNWVDIADGDGNTFSTFALVKEYLTGSVAGINKIVKFLTESAIIGNADKHFEYPLSSPLTIHNINHSLNKIPSITCLLSTGEEIETKTQYPDLNHVILIFSVPTSIRAYLN